MTLAGLIAAVVAVVLIVFDQDMFGTDLHWALCVLIGIVAGLAGVYVGYIVFIGWEET